MSKMPYRAGWQGEGPLRKFTPAERKIDEEKREITFKISTPARDRDGDVIMQDGWVLDKYVANPVVLWAHDAGSPPVAKAKSVRIEGGALVSTAAFPDRETYEFGHTVFQMYKGGFLNAVSVGFMPMELELMEGPEPGDFGFRFLKQELMEYSAVPIPSNPEALVVARECGMDIAPFKKWIEKQLDEGNAGGMSQLLNRTFIVLNGKLHPSLQDEIARRNAENLVQRGAEQLAEVLREKAPAGKQLDEGEPDEEEDTEPEVVATGPTDNPDASDPHTHDLEVGATQTEPDEEDGHIHAVTYEEDGEAVIEEAEGHSHDAPPSAAVDPPVDGEESERSDEEDAEEPDEEPKAFTDWPQKGLNLRVSMLTSDYRPFPLAEAQALREDWPELWALGDGLTVERGVVVQPEEIEGNEQAVRAREAWAARHVDGYRLPEVVAQVRHLVRGSRGIEHMRQVLSLAKEEIIEQRSAKPEMGSEELDAVLSRVMERGVAPAIEAALRRLSGRV